ncbi:MAG: hypothetical protein HYS04_02820 [Acidobacteria bacterium]|nr:hypothetical protein [Acidobacteriota bacterium]
MTNVNIVELDNALVVHTERTPSLVEGVLSAVATAVFVGIAGSFVVGNLGALALAVLAAAIGFFFVRWTRKFELRVTRNEFAAQGKVGDNLGSSRSVSTSDIQWLEYQEDTTGPETAHHPGGLYAILTHRTVCLLPDVDEQQTASVIERIKDKYPDLGAQWSGHSSFRKHFISLGLNDEPR